MNMTLNTAESLGMRILERFQGPPVNVWVEVFIDSELDEGTCGTAIARLTREHQHRWLSIADFLAVYRTLDTKRPEQSPDCPHCDSCGWVQANDRIEHAGTDHERRYTTVKPCRCPVGKQAERSSAWRERTTNHTKEHAA